MSQSVQRFSLFLPLYLGKVNCYLIQLEDGDFVLIDCGGRNQRRALLRALDEAGCAPGSLKTIYLTHGDFDHCGNAATLRKHYGAKIAISSQDTGMIATRDMTYQRSGLPAIAKRFQLLIYSFQPEDQFEPDIRVSGFMDLSKFGFNARAVPLPGHTSGSFGFLTSDGDLFSGDLVVTRGEIEINGLLDNPESAKSSLKWISETPWKMLYPGHGRPISNAEFLEAALID